MRRQVNWLVLAVTALVVVAFAIPLSLLVRNQAASRAQVAAEQRAQSVAAALAVAVSAAGGQVNEGVVESALVADVTVVLPDGARVGDAPAFPELVTAVASGAPSSLTGSDGDWAVGLPVATPAGVLAVVAVASAEELTAGVLQATAVLAGLALALVAGSVLLADRLGHSLVVPVSKLATVANQLAEGDLTARAAVDGPPEVQSVAAALNELAGRLGAIIEGERESLADLSHRLRTPLTALRLQAERSEDADERRLLVEQVDRTQAAVDQLIQDVRHRGQPNHSGSPTDLIGEVQRRIDFWVVLAEHEGRSLTTRIPDMSVQVAAGPSEVTAVLDALVGNVFAHTAVGTAFSVSVRMDGPTPILEVADSGTGFAEPAVLRRGTSGAGSTGLGLDIARGLSERLGGGLEIGEGPGGGALVIARLGP